MHYGFVSTASVNRLKPAAKRLKRPLKGVTPCPLFVQTARLALIAVTAKVSLKHSSMSFSDATIDMPLPFDYPANCFAVFGWEQSNDCGFQVESLSSTSLRADDLNLLCQLFIDPTNDVESASTVATKRERCDRCSSRRLEREQKRLLVSAGAKPSKSTSQSQRQKREIALLKQQVEELEAQLAVLQEQKQQRRREHLSPLKGMADRPARRPERSWKRTATRRRMERQSAEAENAALRDEIAALWGLMMRVPWPTAASSSGNRD